MNTPSPIRQLFAKLFRPFAQVRPDEAVGAAAMMLGSFFLLSAYYLLKTVREPLILLQGGAEMKLYARAAQAVLMVGIVQIYGEIARRVGRMKLLAIVFLFFVSNLVVFALLSRTTIQIGLAFFLWVGLFSYTSVAQFWGLAADIYSEEQGKRLFPLLGIGSTVGAVAGARLAKSLVPFGPYVLMSTAAILLVLSLGLLASVERRAGVAGRRPDATTEAGPLSHEGALHLLLRDRYLLLIAAMIVLLNWVNSAGEYIFDRTVLAAVSDAKARGTSGEAFIGSVKADYFALYNLIGMLLQLFAVSRILTKLGVRNALLFLPAFALFGYSSAAVVPTLAVIRLVKIGENSLQYSLAETSRHALYLVTSRVEKYVGKTSVDTIAVRVGAILSGTIVWIGSRAHVSTDTFAKVNVALCVVWIGIIFAIGKENARRAKGEPRHEEAGSSPSGASPTAAP
jgi:AAA family ATP:ADP antiporter